MNVIDKIFYIILEIWLNRSVLKWKKLLVFCIACGNVFQSGTTFMKNCHSDVIVLYRKGITLFPLFDLVKVRRRKRYDGDLEYIILWRSNSVLNLKSCSKEIPYNLAEYWEIWSYFPIPYTYLQMPLNTVLSFLLLAESQFENISHPYRRDGIR